MKVAKETDVVQAKRGPKRHGNHLSARYMPPISAALLPFGCKNPYHPLCLHLRSLRKEASAKPVAPNQSRQLMAEKRDDSVRLPTGKRPPNNSWQPRIESQSTHTSFPCCDGGGKTNFLGGNNGPRRVKALQNLALHRALNPSKRSRAVIDSTTCGRAGFTLDRRLILSGRHAREMVLKLRCTERYVH